METRAAFIMKLKPGCEEEYTRRHNAIWPELKELLSRSVYDYTIFLQRETLTLFGVQKLKGDGGSQDLGTEPIVQKWWDYMADLMDVNPDNSPVSIPLVEVFHMD